MSSVSDRTGNVQPRNREFGHLHIRRWAKTVPAPTADKERLLLLTLADYADEQAWAAVDQERLAHDMALGVKQTARYLHELADLGLLEIHHEWRHEPGQEKPTRYNTYRLTGIDDDWSVRERITDASVSLVKQHRAEMRLLREENDRLRAALADLGVDSSEVLSEREEEEDGVRAPGFSEEDLLKDRRTGTPSSSSGLDTSDVRSGDGSYGAGTKPLIPAEAGTEPYESNAPDAVKEAEVERLMMDDKLGWYSLQAAMRRYRQFGRPALELDLKSHKRRQELNKERAERAIEQERRRR